MLSESSEHSTALQALEAAHKKFTRLRKQPFSEVKAELELCADTGYSASQAITRESTYHVWFEYAIEMQSFYLTHCIDDRKRLEAYMASMRTYQSFIAGIDESESLTDVLDKTALEGAASQASQAKEPAPESALVEAALDTEKTVGTPKVHLSYEALDTELSRLSSATTAPKRHERAWKVLRDDMYAHAQAARKAQPLAEGAQYAKDTPVIQALALALRVEVAHIEYHKRAGTPMRSLSKMFSHMASFSRLLNSYYRHSDAPKSTRTVFKKNERLMQSQAFNLKSQTACAHVIASEKTSTDEKARAAQKQALYVQSEAIRFEEMCALFPSAPRVTEALMPPVILPIFDFSTFQLHYTAFQCELLRLRASVPAESFFGLFQDVSASLDAVLRCFAAQRHYQLTHLHFVDGELHEGEVDLSQSMLGIADGWQVREILLQMLLLYYEVKQVYLSELQLRAGQDTPEARQMYSHAFIAEVRAATYSYLLSPQVAETPEVAYMHCQKILIDNVRMTPLIHALARQKLQGVEAYLASQPVAEPAAPAELAAPLSRNQWRNKKKRANKKKKQPSASQTTLWDAIELEYANTLSVPGWKATKNKILQCVERGAYTEAQDLLDDWMTTLNEESTDEVLLRKGLFDAWIYQAILFRLKRDVSSAEQSLTKAEGYLSLHVRSSLYCGQAEKLAIEKGILHKLKGDTEAARVALEDATLVAMQNNSYCFYVLYQTYPQTKDNELDFELYDSVIARLNSDIPVPLDDYSRPYFFLLYEKLAQDYTVWGARTLGLSHRDKAFNRPVDVATKEKAEKRLAAGIKLYQILIGQHPDAESAQVCSYHFLKAKAHWMRYLQTATENDKKAARAGYEVALALAKKHGNKDLEAVIVKEQEKLEAIINDKTSSEDRALTAELHEHHLDVCREQYAAFEVTPPRAAEDPEAARSAMFEAMELHDVLTQLKNMIRLGGFAFFIDKDASDKQKLHAQQANFQKEIQALSATYLNQIVWHRVSFTLHYEAYTSDAMKEVSFLVLKQLYQVEQTGLAKFKRMIEDQNLEARYLDGALSEQLSQVHVIQARRVRFIENKIIEGYGAEAFKAANCTLPLARLALDISEDELSTLREQKHMPAPFYLALEYMMNDTQLWPALSELHSLRGCRGLTTSQKESIAYLKLKVLAWGIDALASELFPKLKVPASRDYLRDIFHGMKQCAKACVNTLGSSSFLNGESAAKKRRAIEALSLPSEEALSQVVEENTELSSDTAVASFV